MTTGRRCPPPTAPFSPGFGFILNYLQCKRLMALIKISINVHPKWKITNSLYLPRISIRFGSFNIPRSGDITFGPRAIWRQSWPSGIGHRMAKVITVLVEEWFVVQDNRQIYLNVLKLPITISSPVENKSPPSLLFWDANPSFTRHVLPLDNLEHTRSTITAHRIQKNHIKAIYTFQCLAVNTLKYAETWPDRQRLWKVASCLNTWARTASSEMFCCSHWC